MFGFSLDWLVTSCTLDGVHVATPAGCSWHILLMDPIVLFTELGRDLIILLNIVFKCAGPPSTFLSFDQKDLVCLPFLL